MRKMIEDAIVFAATCLMVAAIVAMAKFGANQLDSHIECNELEYAEASRMAAEYPAAFRRAIAVMEDGWLSRYDIRQIRKAHAAAVSEQAEKDRVAARQKLAKALESQRAESDSN